MRALVAIAALSAGCDQLFQIDQIAIHDGGPFDTSRGSGSADGPVPTTDPLFLSSGFMSYPGDGTLHTSVIASLAGNLDVGTLIVAAICEFPTNPIMIVTDSGGTPFMRAAMADASVTGPALAAQLYYGIVAAPIDNDDVVVQFAAPGVESPDVRVAAYTNIATFTSFEAANGAGDMDTEAASTTVTVMGTPALLVAATCVAGQTTGVDGFQPRVTSANGDVLEDLVTHTLGAQTATARQNTMSGLIVQLAAFKGSGPS